MRASAIWKSCLAESDPKRVCYDSGMSEPDQTTLPGTAWDEASSVRAQNGNRLRRWGSVAEAGRMLWGYKKDTIYALIKAGEIKAVKRGNSQTHNWRVDLVSVWEFKMRRENENA